MRQLLKQEKYCNLAKIILINVIIFTITNLLFNIKYEQVDDFIIYNLYSGLDGTYNTYGIYMHTILCAIIGVFFRIIPTINWHTIFLLSMQFICFTSIGYCIVRKHKNENSIIIYAIFASIFYSALLVLIQYTSVAALLILTAFFLLVHLIESEKISIKLKILCFVLYTIGIMLRIQSLLIIAPFFAIYGIYYLIKYIKKQIDKQKLEFIIKNYAIIAIITITVYISHNTIYESNPLYKEYMEYNRIRATLHDMSYTDYQENKKIFDEIGWSENDHYLFYTFNFGDEKIYSKENLKKIIDYKISTNQYYNLNLDIKEAVKSLSSEMKYTNTIISLFIIAIFLVAMLKSKEKSKLNILILVTTLGINLLFIILNRSMLRVVIPEYIIGTALIIYNMKWKENIKQVNAVWLVLMIIVLSSYSISKYKFDYKLDDYAQYQQVIEYTSNHKENTYLYTVPSLQYRYLAYSVYKMPPNGAFSNLRVMGGWDMFTKNYYDFKERASLEGTFLDLLKENVYLIDGDVEWSGNYYHNYIDKIALFIKEHYNIEVQYEKIEQINNVYIYKITQK